jgi:mono/diheme cytochrome c family protein
MTRLLLLAALAPAWAQNVQEIVAQGEKIFSQTCANGYCHGAKGAAGGAPRLTARGFDQAYLNATVGRGVPGTAMAAFTGSLSRLELAAVVAYVATLNGIANPVVNLSGAASPGPALSAEATRGRELFSDSVRGFARCSTCHEVNGLGIAVATPLEKVPADVRALRGLTTPQMRTATLDGESMPALVLNQGKQRTVFYDLTSSPPVLRTADPAAVKIAEGSGWRHASAIGAYDDAELDSILAFLRAVVR